MCPDGGHDGDRVDVRRGEELLEFRGHRNARIDAAGPCEGFLIFVAERDDLTAVDAVKIPDDIGAPVAVADNRHANEIGWSLVERGPADWVRLSPAKSVVQKAKRVRARRDNGIAIHAHGLSHVGPSGTEEPSQGCRPRSRKAAYRE